MSWIWKERSRTGNIRCNGAALRSTIAIPYDGIKIDVRAVHPAGCSHNLLAPE